VSRENVELVRRIHEAWDRGDSVRDFLAEDIECMNPSYAVEPGTRVGRRALGSVRETYPDFRFHVKGLIEAGDEDVVVLGSYTASGGASGIPLDGEHGYVWTIRDGLPVRFQWFQAHREALEAAGCD
jgi:ketosteroid isomerase-like protein